MNDCIKHSKGKFLAIWNVDDLRTSNSLELQFKALKGNNNAGFSFGSYKIVKKNLDQRMGSILSMIKNLRI